MQAEQYICNEIERFLKSKGVKDLSFNFEKPKQKQFGDISTNIAMQMATILKANPRQIATEIQSFISIDPQYIEKIDIAGPGFLNFFISPNSFYIQLYDIIKKKDKYGILRICISQKKGSDNQKQNTDRLRAKNLRLFECSVRNF